MNQQELENVLSSLDGWCSTEKARALCNLVEEIKPKLILELGVFGGRSLVPMAITQKNIQCGISVGIDHWSYQSSLEGDDIGDDVEYWKNLNYQSIMYECISGINRYGLDNCGILRMKSQDAYSMFGNESIDILHQDGNHSEYINCLEVELYMPKLRSGGYWISDDSNIRTVKKSLDMILEHCDIVSSGKNSVNFNGTYTIFKKR